VEVVAVAAEAWAKVKAIKDNPHKTAEVLIQGRLQMAKVHSLIEVSSRGL